MLKSDKSVIVYLITLSGRHDPCWKLKKDEIAEFKEKLENLSKTKEIEYPVLGYKGFHVINKDGILGTSERIIVFNKTIRMKENSKVIFYEDKNDIEEWLFKQGIKQGHEKIIEAIK